METPEDTDRLIGGRLEAIRVGRGLNQSQLSDLLRKKGLNWSQRTISRIESGERAIKFSESFRLSSALAIDPEALIPAQLSTYYLRQQSIWNLRQAYKQARDAKWQLDLMSGRAQAWQLFTEVANGETGPYLVHGTCADLIKYASEVSTLDGAQDQIGRDDLLSILGVPPAEYQMRIDAIEKEIQIFLAGDSAMPAYLKNSEWMSKLRPEQARIAAEMVFADKFCEEVVRESLPFLSFTGESAELTGSFSVDGIADLRPEIDPDDLDLDTVSRLSAIIGPNPQQD